MLAKRPKIGGKFSSVTSLVKILLQTQEPFPIKLNGPSACVKDRRRRRWEYN